MQKIISYTFKTLFPSLIGALPITVYIMVMSFIFAFVLATFLAYIRLKNIPVAKHIVNGYITFIRGTPELAQLFLVYFGLPQLLTAIGIDSSNWSTTTFVIITFSLNVAGYLAEVMRSAYSSVERGQQEAAFTVGMTNFQAFRRIILPQAFGVALPNLGNTIIILFKDTSLAFTIGVIDIMGEAQIISSRDYGVTQLEIYVVAAIVYWVICIIMERGVIFLEKIYKRGTKLMA